MKSPATVSLLRYEVISSRTVVLKGKTSLKKSFTASAVSIWNSRNCCKLEYVLIALTKDVLNAQSKFLFWSCAILTPIKNSLLYKIASSSIAKFLTASKIFLSSVTASASYKSAPYASAPNPIWFAE